MLKAGKMSFRSYRIAIMFRFYFVIFINLFRIPYLMRKMQRYADNPEKYSEEERYALARHIVEIIRCSGAIRTVADGTENLPEQGGYFLYPNHQGKYDVLGIVLTHNKPLSFIIDDKASHGPVVSQFTDLLHGGRIKIDDLKQTILLFKERAAQVASGQRCIIFPEGVYSAGKKNTLDEFKPGSFKLAQMARMPIVPVALFDSYKPFNSSCFGPVKTYVRYLAPIPYEEYAHLKTSQIAGTVRERIRKALSEIESVTQ